MNTQAGWDELVSGEDKAVPVGVVYLYSEGGCSFSELVGPDRSVVS